MQDLKRLNFLIDQASAVAGSDNKLAIELGTSRQVVSNWRHGIKSPGIEMVEKMAKIAGMDPAPLIILAAVEKTDNAAAIDLIKRLMKSTKTEWAYTSLTTWFRGSRAGQAGRAYGASPHGACA